MPVRAALVDLEDDVDAVVGELVDLRLDRRGAPTAWLA